MNISLWNKRDPGTLFSPTNGGISRLRDEMDRTFNRFFNDPWAMIEPKDLRKEGWLPAIDVSESDNEVTVRAEIPGIPVKDLDISITGTILTMAGEKSEEQEKKGEDWYQCERRFGSFRRVVELPESIDPDKVTAESENGIITIHVAKKPGVKPKKVEVKPTAKKVAVSG